MRSTDIKDYFNKKHKEEFDEYFKEIQMKEEEKIQEIGNAYADTYKLYITEQEEDEQYIEGTKELLDNKNNDNLT